MKNKNKEEKIFREEDTFQWSRKNMISDQKKAVLRNILISIITLLSFFNSLNAQPANQASYKLNFTVSTKGGVTKDTSLSLVGLSFWTRSADFPSYLKWKDLPFAIRKSPIDGVGLFTDSESSFVTGQTIGYAFKKICKYGVFEFDYVQTNIGAYVNDSHDPNMDIFLSDDGIILKAKKNISPNTELTASYQELIDLFPNDKSIIRKVKYW